MRSNATKNKGQREPEVLKYSTGKSDLGTVLVASSPKGIVAVLIAADEAEVLHDLQKHFPKAVLVSDKDVRESVRQVVEYIHSPKKDVDLKLDLRGTDFQKNVWQTVRRIPLGSTTTYTELAAAIGHPKAVRAVGNACTINPLAFAVPCHRVLHSNPSLSFGHHRGNDRMRPMVARERKEIDSSGP